MVQPPSSSPWIAAAHHLRDRTTDRLGPVINGSIRRLLVLLVLIAVLPALGIILMTGFEARNHALIDAEHNAQILAQGIGEIQERTTHGLRQLLEKLAEEPRIKAGDAGAVAEGFKIVAAAFPMVANITLAGPDGSILSTAAPTQRTSLADLPAFERAMSRGAFTAGAFQRAAPDAPPTFPFVQPLRDAKGALLGQLVLTIRLDTYGNIFKHADLPLDSVLSIVDRAGRRIYRMPSDPLSGIGSPLPTPLRAAVARKHIPQGAVDRIGADGVDRIYAYSQLRLGPGEDPYLTIVVGIPRQQSLDRANALLRRNLYLLALALGLSLCLAWLVGSGLLGRRLDTIVAVTGTLGSGDLTARIPRPLGTGALGRLERSVNAMAEALARGSEAARRSAANLRQSEATLRTVADFTYDWEYWKGPDGRFLWIAPACQRISGHSVEEYMADAHLMFDALVHPDDAAAWREHAGAELSPDRSQRTLQLRIIRPDGRTIWIHHHCRPIFSHSGEYLGIRGCNRDISARKEVEAALRRSHEELERRVRERTRELTYANDKLRKSEERYRVLYEQSAVGILLMNREGRIEDANPAACQILAHSLEELRGRNYLALIEPNNLGDNPFDMTRAMAGEVSRIDRVFLTEEGRRVHASVSGRRINEDVYQAVFRDISERKKLEALREDVERITRHDLKAPLMGVIHMPRLILKNKNLPARDIELLHLLQESGYRMLHMINMSLALYQMETGTYACKREPFDILRTASRSLHETRLAAEAKNIRMAVRLDGVPVTKGDAFPVVGEEMLCLTMLENLIKNAIEAAPAGGECRIEGDTRLRTLRVANSGEVPEGIRERFFEKYVTSGKRWGTGLGTYSARLIARTNGWDIALSCEIPGETSVILSFGRDEDGRTAA
ncbi:multi-sensor signal transduction histidine kinase [Solidesulfovibrio fructosivorans JJ]]|uniref:histidine kinase n=1 Tax=Solidesulfovibrio fructosivorans JJ] TaxID=596151 RepID=E1JY15_SOLFR|nr:PAS domain S-box protein [Solidesulfovibrio fructosivorans]EFL50753.1 multi-sensor signal transduction histidine kinase [Solidesulfovibrio fructosivorans JJ]]